MLHFHPAPEVVLYQPASAFYGPQMRAIRFFLTAEKFTEVFPACNTTATNAWYT
jgi:hypothetical protein